MYDFKITKTDFMINGKKELLLCGELHYFRMEKQYWEKALDALVDWQKEDKLFENQQLFRTPIVRNGRQATVGYQPDVWKNWE